MMERHYNPEENSDGINYWEDERFIQCLANSRSLINLMPREWQLAHFLWRELSSNTNPDQWFPVVAMKAQW